MSNLHLLAAGFSAIFGEEVVTPGKGTESIFINQLFSCTHSTFSMMEVPPGETFYVYVQYIVTGKTITLKATNCATVAELKDKLALKEGLPASVLRFRFNGRELDDDATLGSVGIGQGSTIYFRILLRGGGPPKKYQLDPSLLDPGYDYDFTNEKDDGQTYKRGKFPYKRPYGWSRVALRVRGIYGDDDWLGPNGIRTESSSGEWPVSYHGTNFASAKKIAEHGYKAGPGAVFGRGVYSSPSLDMVEECYAQSFSLDGKTYLIVFQNRVNPDAAGGRLKIIPASENGSGADYWLSPKHDAETKYPRCSSVWGPF